MSTFLGTELVELRRYANPSDPENSSFVTKLPMTSFDAVIDPETGKSLAQVLKNGGPGVVNDGVIATEKVYCINSYGLPLLFEKYVSGLVTVNAIIMEDFGSINAWDTAWVIPKEFSPAYGAQSLSINVLISSARGGHRESASLTLYPPELSELEEWVLVLIPEDIWTMTSISASFSYSANASPAPAAMQVSQIVNSSMGKMEISEVIERARRHTLGNAGYEKLVEKFEKSHDAKGGDK